MYFGETKTITRSEKTKLKYSRMRKLLDAVRNKPLTIHEALRILQNKVSRRMVENYFAELKALGLVEYDLEAKIYQVAGLKKRVFESKHDYNLALKHSRNLVFSTNENQRFDQMDPFLALDILAFYDLTWEPQDIDDKCFLQHLKTGYFREVYALMQRYRQLADELGFSKVGGFPKIHTSEFYFAGTPKQLVTEASTLKNGYNLRGRAGTRKKKLKEIFHLRNLLVGKIYSILNDVRNGIPLRGYCDYCPDRKLTIEK